MTKKKTIHDFPLMKKEGKKITFLTSYDFPTAQFAEAAGLDMLLVGDSLGMCVYGYEGTVPVTMDQMIFHARGGPQGRARDFRDRRHALHELPESPWKRPSRTRAASSRKPAATRSSWRAGNVWPSIIRAIVDAGIVVMGHIGLTPQSSGQLGGHKAQGRTAEQAQLVVEDALAVQEAGAHMILLEAIPPEVGSHIANTLNIPVLSIGAGPGCDGQLLIVSDLIGQFQAFTPKFVKRYCDVASIVTDAMRRYAEDVRNGAFPEDTHCYTMIEGEEEKFRSFAKGT